MLEYLGIIINWLVVLRYGSLISYDSIFATSAFNRVGPISLNTE